MLFEARRLLSLAAVAALSAGLLAGGPASRASAQLGAEVEIAVDQIAFYADMVVNFDAMEVRIADPDGTLVVDVRSLGDPVTWGPSALDLDGLYRYEVAVISIDPSAAGADAAEARKFVVRRKGTFEVIDGAIAVDNEADSLR